MCSVASLGSLLGLRWCGLGGFGFGFSLWACRLLCRIGRGRLLLGRCNRFWSPLVARRVRREAWLCSVNGYGRTFKHCRKKRARKAANEQAHDEAWHEVSHERGVAGSRGFGRSVCCCFCHAHLTRNCCRIVARPTASRWVLTVSI